MLQHYLSGSSVLKPQVVLSPAKTRLILLASLASAFSLYLLFLFNNPNQLHITAAEPAAPVNEPVMNNVPPVDARIDSVATVVAKALYFKSLLTTTQQSTLQQAYTTTLARKWSNLPCGSGCRNGIQFSTLTATQLAAALDVIRAATGTSTIDGYAEFDQVRKADAYLKTNGGGSGYDSTIYFIAFLNNPSTTGAWMLQFGGHHYAGNIAYNGGKVVGATPYFMGVEPTSFTMNSVSYTPLKAEHDSFAVMLASLTTAQLATAKLTSTYSDCLMSPGESNGNTNTFPATKAGLRANTLTSAQKSTVFAAIKNYTSDLDDSTAAVLQAIYEADIDNTYISWTGSGTAGSSGTFLTANTNYVRLDGNRIWIEFICQSGVVFQSQIHYHTVFRDHVSDYGIDLTATTLPLTLLNLDAKAVSKGRQLDWTTANEYKVGYFELQRATNPAAGFTTIAKVNATNNRQNTYTYTDNESISENIVYYRLNMVDLDGRTTFSNVVSVKYNNAATGMTIYPNPVQNLLTISNAAALTNATISILNSDGKMVLRSSNRSGRNVNMDVTNLASGSYLVQIIDGGRTTTLKFVKQQ